MKVGDIVLYNHGVHETVMVSDQPLAALVTYVHAAAKEGHPVRVNLAVFGKNGDQWQKHSVPVWDHEGEPIERRLAFAYPVGSDPFPEARKPVENEGEPADSASDFVHQSNRGPNKIASGPTVGDAYRSGAEYPLDGPAPVGWGARSQVEAMRQKERDAGEWNGDAPTGFEAGLVYPPIGPEYKPNAEHPMPNAPETINKVPADSPANPDRPLD